MNKTTLILLLVVCFTACRQNALNHTATIAFKQTEHNFGKLKFNGEGQCIFTYSNSGATPLTIQHVKSSCGCTVPKWTKKPIKQGKTGEINISYDTGQPGAFHKTITVFYNGKNSPATLTIKGNVAYPKEIAKKL